MFEFMLPAEPSFVPLARRAVSRIGSVYGLSPAQMDDVRLALTELVTNVVRHAYPADRPGSV